MADKRVGIIAGRGHLPLAIRQSCEKQGIPFYVIALKGFGEHVAEGLPDEQFSVLRLGQGGTIARILMQKNYRHMVMAGGVKMTNIWDLRPDFRAFLFFAKLGWQLGKDHNLLEAAKVAIEREGFTLLGADELVAGLRAEQGAYSKALPSPKDWKDLRQAWTIAKALGSVDVGQGCIVQRSYVLTLEASEGTEAMIARSKDLRRTAKGGVLVKVMKPQQDKRLDLPTIGPDTVRQAAEAGLAGIAVEADGAMVLQSQEVRRLADKHGLFVIATNPAEIGEQAS